MQKTAAVDSHSYIQLPYIQHLSYRRIYPRLWSSFTRNGWSQNNRCWQHSSTWRAEGTYCCNVERFAKLASAKDTRCRSEEAWIDLEKEQRSKIEYKPIRSHSKSSKNVNQFNHVQSVNHLLPLKMNPDFAAHFEGLFPCLGQMLPTHGGTNLGWLQEFPNLWLLQMRKSACEESLFAVFKFHKNLLDALLISSLLVEDSQSLLVKLISATTCNILQRSPCSPPFCAMGATASWALASNGVQISGAAATQARLVCCNATSKGSDSKVGSMLPMDMQLGERRYQLEMPQRAIDFGLWKVIGHKDRTIWTRSQNTKQCRCHSYGPRYPHL